LHRGFGINGELIWLPPASQNIQVHIDIYTSGQAYDQVNGVLLPDEGKKSYSAFMKA
jgi:hypothetical protein